MAERMAGMTRIIRDLISNFFEHEQEKGWLHNWLAAFRETLIPDLDSKQFADMFAQTLAYGLFAARVHSLPKKDFSREMAAYQLPKTNPFLRKLFAEIAGVDMPDTIAWAVDDIVELLKHADFREILKDFGKGQGKEDPVVHFYETFLAAYDPKMREVRGVYYTPEPVVSYIVRSLDHLLKKHFNRPKGLADENTLILDPATGTATFLYFVIDHIHRSFAKQQGAWDGYVAKHLLNRIFGFELLMAPYSIAHLKLGMQLQETGYTFGSDQRLGIFLTNTLEEAAQKSDQLFAGWVADEANAAAKIKRDDPILVVLGNPPYANFGRMNRGAWILNLLKDYKRDLHEKKLNLDDDFIKFLRFAQWRIDQTGHGIVGFITNNTYIDGLTHRRMREALMESFDEIYILNLHGSSKKQEQTPDGGKDENVFDITVGVSIALFVKLPPGAKERGAYAPSRAQRGVPASLSSEAVGEGADHDTRGACAPQATIHHADLWGARENKYAWLWQNDASSTPWKEIQPTKPNFFFVPKDFGLATEYEAGWKLSDIFPTISSGIQTKRDDVAIADSQDILHERIKAFAEKPVEEIRQHYALPADGRDWRVDLASQHAKSIIQNQIKESPLLYRPFDERWTYITDKSKGLVAYPRYETMRHFAGRNIGLELIRK